MKKINTLLHDQRVQGSLIIGFIFAAIALTLILTAGK